jgi:tetratricopeptide (TPR) repeat protein
MVLCCEFGAAHAEDGIQVYRTEVEIHADKIQGSELAEQAPAIDELIRAGKFDEADEKAKTLIAAFEASLDPALPHYSFQTRADMEAFQHDTTAPFVWVDWGYKQLLHRRAYIAVERGLMQDALLQLQLITVVAPIDANTLTETGFVLGQLKRSDEALAAYRKALEVSRHFESQRPFEPMALRGIGFQLIEHDQLDEAERAYRDSLLIDPNNKTALNELDFIAGVRKRRAGKSSE